MIASVLVSLLALLSPSRAATVGSKAFTEGFVLAEYAAQTIEDVERRRVVRRFGLGGTGIVYQALRKGEIDVYPEYAGTIAESILRDPKLKTLAEIRAALEPLGLTLSESLGFSNTYALAVSHRFAQAHGLRTVSDLARLAADGKTPIRAAFSHEFISRRDGFGGLSERYRLRLPTPPQAMEHSLAYEAIAAGQADLIDAYSTDAKIGSLGLTALQDDLGFFPLYPAAFLARLDFVAREPKSWAALRALEGRFSQEKMRQLNGAVDLERQTFSAVVAGDRGVAARPDAAPELSAASLLNRTKQHLTLVGLALAFSIVAGVPLGAIARRSRRFSQLILLASGTAQTIPSLALLCFLIPIFGIGLTPALVALCIYGLLPVVLNTFTGLRGVDSRLIDAARALDISEWDRFRLIELPLASPSILAGIKTSAIAGIGTATLAALVGAGGYGAPILSGLAINDVRVILIGALPAAGLAIACHFAFEALESIVIPKALR